VRVVFRDYIKDETRSIATLNYTLTSCVRGYDRRYIIARKIKSINMSSVSFYATKALAISTVAIVFAIVLAVFSFALSRVMPDDPNESVQMSILYILAYTALASCAVWIART
jgi:hypothetical protein